MPAEPLRRMIDALAVHFAAQLPASLNPSGQDQNPGALAYVYRGWPDQRELAHYPSISIDAPAGGTFEGRNPVPLKPYPTGIGARGYHYAVGTVRADLQLDVFADSAPQRDKVLKSIRTALRAQVPLGTVLRLDPGDGLPGIGYTIQSAGAFGDSSAGVGSDQWRGTLVVTAECLEVIEVTEAGLTELQLVLSTEGYVPIVVGDPIVIFDENGPGPIVP